jgi:nicotinate-nucleotide pyrophosphorylase (carboxylating)
MTASTEMPTSFAGTKPAPRMTSAARQGQLRRAFFRGEDLQLTNPQYVKSVRGLLGELLSSDIGSGDLTVSALQINDQHGCAKILAKEPGVIAGVAEFRWLVTRDDLEVKVHKQDGERIEAGDIILEVQGRRNDLLMQERVGLNLLQRMSGIATTARHHQDLLHRHNPEAQVIGTRKTPWGLLDKRALHLGGAGTHRLGLWDAILVKNNHLALLAGPEEEAVRIAVERIWPARTSTTFIEVEVGTEAAALAAAEAFRRMQEGLQAEPVAEVACVLLLDNMPPAKVSAIIQRLFAKKLLDYVLTEASGNISETNMEEYAASGVDAISIGALTHSVRALDLCERL